jgi:hypothetical protein
VCVVKKIIDKGYTNIFLRIILTSARVLESNFEVFEGSWKTPTPSVRCQDTNNSLLHS